ncbi:MAG: hypothetical protein M1823_002177 [Watsoniomyces obsoletus]|nr:MAG: hypothetical protein M1823_002177 [Watsoniomyces obsoletus]
MGPENEDEDDNEKTEQEVQKHLSDQTGPYFLRTIVDDIPLSADGTGHGIDITCVELWEGNLYVGTSNAEVLHFVLLPANSDDDADAGPEFMLASRSEIQYAATTSTNGALPGVQQILLLTKVNKACILCNGTLTFYSLPELSPAFGSNPIRNCNWVGGIDLNQDDEGQEEGQLFMLSRKSRINLIRLGDDPRPIVRNIEYPGSLISVRRGAFACVANSRSYALLDIDHQQKIPLFPISSLEESSSDLVGGGIEDIRPNHGSRSQQDRHASPGRSPGRNDNNRGHGRNTSLSALVGGFGRRNQASRSSSVDQMGQASSSDSHDPPEPSVKEQSISGSEEIRSASATASNDKPLPPPPPAGQSASSSISGNGSRTALTQLRPHVVSPKPTEFLLTTGTTDSDAGVGIFVNLDGDVCRGTIEFERYPEDLVVDVQDDSSTQMSNASTGDSDDCVLAVIRRDQPNGSLMGIEIQHLNAHDETSSDHKAWLRVPSQPAASPSVPEGPSRNKVGIRTVSSSCDVSVDRLSKILQLVRLCLRREDSIVARGTVDLESESAESLNGPTARTKSEMAMGDGDGVGLFTKLEDEKGAISRQKEEERFARRFSTQHSRLVVWSGNRIWWIVRNPFAIRHDATLEALASSISHIQSLNPQRVVDLLAHLRGQEPKNEAHFLSLGYIRQKASLLLFARVLTTSTSGATLAADDLQITEDALLEGGVDPRAVMAMIPFLRYDINEGEQGIWVHGGIRTFVQTYLSSLDRPLQGNGSPVELSPPLLQLLQRYLFGWRRKKGFGSIADEKHVFESVDAGVLHTLLEVERSSRFDSTVSSSTRVELYALVDQGVDCFDWAVQLLERYRRLYVLSRLYQSRKQSKNVLATWKRIIEGEVDEGGEFEDGENEVRKYLSKIRDAGVFTDYGVWLAQRNPALGVQVFSERKSRVRLEQDRVIAILKSGAPVALKQYLEHLVFGRNDARYANDLVSYYLDSVLGVLEHSARARSILVESYQTYRALRPPRPTYREFIIEHPTDERWWDDRLRLLQLLGGSHGAATTYDVPSALARLEPFEKELVPEMIILDGQQSRHESALRLLTHGLGDYDSAINYCLLGGSGIFHPTFGATPVEAIPSRTEQATLFDHLLLEFLHIEDPSHRVEQTSRLLERFGRWYDVPRVLRLIPEEWSIELVATFLISALRRMRLEMSETTIARALCGAENLQVQVLFLDRCAEVGPSVEAAE